MLGQDPTKRFICSSYSSDLAIKLGNVCREIMSSPWYRQLFPKTKFSRLKNTETEFATTQMGYRLATSIEGTLTGRGGDFIILDDPIKPIDALSDSKRERVNNAFVNTIMLRLDDKQSGSILIVMQRLHEDDLVGRLLREAPEEWAVLSLPAIAEQEKRSRSADRNPMSAIPAICFTPSASRSRSFNLIGPNSDRMCSPPNINSPLFRAKG
jgi:hypothetical protein